jgi:pimeloyl-ACP methyl ester carboxylesterase
VSAPTILIWGERDALVPPIYADEFAALLRDARKVLIADAGHLPQLEQPEPVGQAVLEFLGSS